MTTGQKTGAGDRAVNGVLGAGGPPGPAGPRDAPACGESPREARIPESVVAKMQGASATQWAVLVSLYLHADRNGVCWPSVHELERLTGRDRRSVTRAIMALTSAGVFIRTKVAGKANTYQLPTRGTHAPSSREVGAHTPPVVGASGTPTRGNPVPQLGAPTPLKQEVLEQCDEQEEHSPADRFAEEFWPCWPGFNGTRKHGSRKTAHARFQRLTPHEQERCLAAEQHLIAAMEDGRLPVEFQPRAENFIGGSKEYYQEWVDGPPARYKGNGRRGLGRHPQDSYADPLTAEDRAFYTVTGRDSVCPTCGVFLTFDEDSREHCPACDWRPPE